MTMEITPNGYMKYRCSLGKWNRTEGAFNGKCAESIARSRLYLEYVNDWLTTSKMAEHYNIEKKTLDNLINYQRELQGRNS